MGEVKTVIKLVNLREFNISTSGFREKDDFHQIELNVKVDTGTKGVVLSEEDCKSLALEEVEGGRQTVLLGGVRHPCRTVEAVILWWKDRYMSIMPTVLEGNHETLLGAIPLEDMDLTVNPGAGRVEGAHGDDWVFLVR